MRTGKPTNDKFFPLFKNSGEFYVDRHGRIWTTRYDLSRGHYTDRWRRAELAPSGGGRRQIRFNGIVVYAHRFVWYWFNGDIPEGLEVDHINNDKEDNRPSNLQLLTRKQNQQKAEKDGLISPSRKPSQGRKEGARKFWNKEGRVEQMSTAATQGWLKRKEHHV